MRQGQTFGRKGQKALALAVALCVLPSCALLKRPEAPRQTYELTAPDSFATAGGTRSQLLVKVPNALKGLDSDRVLVKADDGSISLLAGVQWVDTIPAMVQAKLVESFENTGRAGATAKPGDGLVIDHQLISDLRRFEIDRGRAVIELSIKLLADKSGQVLETRIFTATAPVRGTEPGDNARALTRAFESLAKDVVAWVFAEV
ncbi:MAG: ABC-type transport auxiliary lipoprotein family protein [Pseudomonadota bacterium]